ncbi:enoyl-CoA hydratase/isomerase family protein [Paraburkholderia sediminicola]|uniref:enoyl-CoA hydratase/isomerase family protein n=1 Tax=Paraburkholderia sediminicola TaxID=458836 RepID=UPI0038B8875F
MTNPDHLIRPDAPVLYWRDGAIAHLRFNRPQVLNAIDLATAQCFRTTCDRIADDRNIRAVVISAEGRAFMAGGDLAAMRADPVTTARALIESMHSGISVLASLDAPVIASVHGAVAGGGLGLLLGCDLAIAAEGTRFNLAYLNVGASSDCSTSWGLPRLVGLRKAMEIALLGGTFGAAEALLLGIVNRVVPLEQLHQESEAMAGKLAHGPTRALGRLKRLLRDSAQRSLDEHLAAEAEAFLECAASRDFSEGVDAFIERRTPRFQGT